MRVMKENEVGTVVIEAAIEVHRALGPGLLESVYEAVLAYELRERGLEVERQVAIPIRYKAIEFEEGFRGGSDCRRESGGGIEIGGDDDCGAPETDSNVPPADAGEARVSAELWGGADERGGRAGGEWIGGRDSPLDDFLRGGACGSVRVFRRGRGLGCFVTMLGYRRRGKGSR